MQRASWRRPSAADDTYDAPGCCYLLPLLRHHGPSSTCPASCIARCWRAVSGPCACCPCPCPCRGLLTLMLLLLLVALPAPCAPPGVAASASGDGGTVGCWSLSLGAWGAAAAEPAPPVASPIAASRCATGTAAAPAGAGSCLSRPPLASATRLGGGCAAAAAGGGAGLCRARFLPAGHTGSRLHVSGVCVCEFVSSRVCVSARLYACKRLSVGVKADTTTGRVVRAQLARVHRNSTRPAALQATHTIGKKLCAHASCL